MSPELTILIINAVFLAYAYLWAYPAMPEKTWGAIMWRDLAISLAALGVAALLYWGRDEVFSMILFDTNWFVFSVGTLIAMETPLFLWFAKKHGLTWEDPD